MKPALAPKRGGRGGGPGRRPPRRARCARAPRRQARSSVRRRRGATPTPAPRPRAARGRGPARRYSARRRPAGGAPRCTSNETRIHRFTENPPGRARSTRRRGLGRAPPRAAGCAGHAGSDQGTSEYVVGGDPHQGGGDRGGVEAGPPTGRSAGYPGSSRRSGTRSLATTGAPSRMASTGGSPNPSVKGT